MDGYLGELGPHLVDGGGVGVLGAGVLEDSGTSLVTQRKKKGTQDKT